MSDDQHDQDTMVQYDPDEVGQRPYLRTGGKYGNGMEHEADIVVSRFVPVRDLENAPAFMKDEVKDALAAGRPSPQWARITYSVVSEEFGKVFVDQDVRHGKQLHEVLTQLGVAQSTTETTDDQGRPRKSTVFRTGDVVGTKVGCLEIGDPRRGDNGIWYTGRVKQVVGV